MSIRSNVSKNLNLNTLLIAIAGYYLKTSAVKLDRNNDLLQGAVVRIEELDQRVSKLEAARDELNINIQKIWDRNR